MADLSRIATEAAPFARDLNFWTLAAATPGASREDVRTALTKAFQNYYGLRLRMEALEALAPNCRDAGYGVAKDLREIAASAEARR